MERKFQKKIDFYGFLHNFFAKKCSRGTKMLKDHCLQIKHDIQAHF